jgi:hypothetical protein
MTGADGVVVDADVAVVLEVVVVVVVTARTVIVMVFEALPQQLVPVIVYRVEATTALGVPLISPVAVFKLSPPGRSGETEYVIASVYVRATAELRIAVMAVDTVKLAVVRYVSLGEKYLSFK